MTSATAVVIPVYVRSQAREDGPAHLLEAHVVMLGWPDAVGERRALAGRPACGAMPGSGLWRLVGAVEETQLRQAEVCPACQEVQWRRRR